MVFDPAALTLRCSALEIAAMAHAHWLDTARRTAGELQHATVSALDGAPTRAIALGACLLLSTGLARAQGSCPAQARADALEDEGQALRRAHRDAEALQRFEASWALCHGPRALVRRGLAEWAMGRWLDAEAHVVEGLEHREDPWVRDNRDAIMREDLAAIRTHLGSIELSGSEGRGEVWVGGRRAAEWPASGPLRVVAGESTVMVRAAGFEPWRRVVMVPAGGLARESVDLVPVEAVRAPGARLGAATVPRREAPVGPVASRPSGVLRGLAWASSGVALAAGGAALATWLAHDGARGDFEASSCESPLDAATQARCLSIADRRDTMGALAAASGIASGVFAIGAVALWVGVAGERTARRSARGLACAPTWGLAGFACAARF